MATINQELFKKFKKLPFRQEGDGHEIEVEVREDEEQSVKLQEIIDLLVAAGYFRARIKGLSPFDKVVGGMTWCIDSCSVDIDVDLLFQENSTIGQKIALTEKIVAVLPKMKCPHLIEPHQIQGLDFIHIFPVIQWLVKRSVEHRQERSSFVRSYAINQFHKEFSIADKDSDIKRQIISNVNSVKEMYRPHRYFKRKNNPPPDINSRVQITLLEYGHKADTSSNSSVNDNSDEVLVEKRKLPVEILDIDSLDEEDRQNLEKHYASLQLELKDGGLKSRQEIQLTTLEEQNQTIQNQCQKLLDNKNSLEISLKETTTTLEEIRLKQQEADKALKELEDSEVADSDSVKEVQEMVMLSDSLRSQEIQFREQCKQELVRLQNLIEETKNAKTPVDNSPDLNKEMDEETEKIRVARLQLAKKNRIVAALQRQLDDVPSRAELAQYQRRFLELYNQVAAKHKETKQYYTLYNTLEDTRLYMKKELSLLNSISENYPEAMQSNSSKEEFLNQLQNIVEGVRQSKMKVQQKLSIEKKTRDELSDTLQGLVELQRKYVTAIRQLSIECRKQKVLLANSK